jgi:hypothetical protein
LKTFDGAIAINQRGKTMRKKRTVLAFGIAVICIAALSASIWASANGFLRASDQTKREIAPQPTPPPGQDQVGNPAQSCPPPDCSVRGAPAGIWDFNNCVCEYSALLIDTRGDGFALTDPQGGVNFDMDTLSHYFQGVWQGPRTSWTAANSGDAFLFMDHNANGIVDNSVELFGNLTPQRVIENRNGFLALAFQDRPDHGGNGDGVIDRQDSVFPKLRLWLDVNHNGISEPSELHTLPELGIEAISLDYKESMRRDQNRNLFRCCAHVYGPKHKDLGPRACDVLLRPSR